MEKPVGEVVDTVTEGIDDVEADIEARVVLTDKGVTIFSVEASASRLVEERPYVDTGRCSSDLSSKPGVLELSLPSRFSI